MAGSFYIHVSSPHLAPTVMSLFSRRVTEIRIMRCPWVYFEPKSVDVNSDLPFEIGQVQAGPDSDVLTRVDTKPRMPSPNILPLGRQAITIEWVFCVTFCLASKTYTQGLTTVLSLLWIMVHAL